MYIEKRPNPHVYRGDRTPTYIEERPKPLRIKGEDNKTTRLFTNILSERSGRVNGYSVNTSPHSSN